MKDFFNKSILGKYNLRPSDLINTKWLKKSMQELLLLR